MKIVVTRHPALVDYLKQKGFINQNTPVISHATEDDVRGKDVIGVLPLRLAVLATTVTEVPLDIPADKRGQELTINDMYQMAGDPVTYQVRTI